MREKKFICKDALVSQIEGIDTADLNGEKVMMNLEKGKYFALNSTGSRIWDIIKKPIEVKEISNVLLREYKIEAKACEEAVIDFLGKLSDAQLISVV